MSSLKFIFFLLFFSLTSSSLFSFSVSELTVFAVVEVTQLQYAGESASIAGSHDFAEKKFFRIGKKIFRNPFYKSPDRFLKDKVSTVFIILLTGPLGGHRLYLGTKPIVPVVYAVTLGGGIGILPIIDMFVVIFTKDLNRYIDNDRIIMWIE